jgi:hypothetical protein
MNNVPEHPHWGSTLDDFLQDEGICEEATTAAIKQIVASQLSEEMKKEILARRNSAD